MIEGRRQILTSVFKKKSHNKFLKDKTCPSLEEWRNKWWCSHIMENYVVVKIKKLHYHQPLSHAGCINGPISLLVLSKGSFGYPDVISLWGHMSCFCPVYSYCLSVIINIPLCTLNELVWTINYKLYVLSGR